MLVHLFLRHDLIAATPSRSQLQFVDLEAIASNWEMS